MNGNDDICIIERFSCPEAVSKLLSVRVAGLRHSSVAICCNSVCIDICPGNMPE
jgi:hypothetical protein